MTLLKKASFRRLFHLFLGLSCAWILFSACSLIGHATGSAGTVKNPILNVRSYASTSSSILCKLSQGSKVTILSETTGTDGLKWYQVSFTYKETSGKGYVRSDLITLTAEATADTTPDTSSTGALKSIRPNAAIVRSGPSTATSIRTRLYKGTVVTLISEETASDGYKWSKVSYESDNVLKEGYIRSDLLTAAPAGSSAAPDSGSTSSGASDSTDKYIRVNVALVRTYASTNGDIRARLPQETIVTVIKTVTGPDDGRSWYKVAYSTDTLTGEGYIRGDLLADVTGSSGSASGSGSSSTDSASSGSDSAGSSDTATATVKPTIANIRTYASTNGDIRSKLPSGTAVTIVKEKTGEDGMKWYKIAYSYGGNDLQGYIRGDLLILGDSGSSSSSNSSNNSDTSGDSGNSDSGGIAQVLSYASPNADVRATLTNGTKVTILKEVVGEDGEKWSKISFEQNGVQMEGYVRSSVLK